MEPRKSNSADALRKAANALDPQVGTDNAISVVATHAHARLNWNDWAVVLTVGGEDKTIAEDLDYGTAVGVAHALDAVYGYRVYDQDGVML